jgi:hypothetical protein
MRWLAGRAVLALLLIPLVHLRPLADRRQHHAPPPSTTAAGTAAALEAALAAERVAAARGGGLAALGRRLQQFAIGVPVGPIRRGVARVQENINLIQLTLSLYLQGDSAAACTAEAVVSRRSQCHSLPRLH